ncbi:MAG: LCP family protein, partial [Intestinibacter sp.]
MYCLLLGQSEELTDTIMIAEYDPQLQQASILSIPRDTFIGDNEATATPSQKINAVYS